MTTPQDNGPAQNTVEKDVGILDQDSLAATLRQSLFSDEQEEAQPEPLTEGEDQTEVKDVEAEATAEEDVPQAEDGEESPHTDEVETDDEELPRGVQKRIDKLTAFRKQAEEQVSELKKELNELRQKLETSKQEEQDLTKTQSRSSGDNPFSHLQTAEEVEKEAENARWLRYKCEENPEGFEHDGNFYGPEQVRQMKVNALKALETHLPKQRGFIDARNSIDPIAEKTYSWWKNPESKEYKLAKQVLNHYPDFKRFPDYKLFIGDYVRGFMARELSAIKQTAKPAPNLGVRPTSMPSKTKPTDIRAKSAKERFAKSGNAEDLANYLMSSDLI